VKSMRRCEGAATFGRKKVQRVPKGYMQALCSGGFSKRALGSSTQDHPQEEPLQQRRIHLRRPTCHLHISLAKQRRTIHCEFVHHHPERIEKCKISLCLYVFMVLCG